MDPFDEESRVSPAWLSTVDVCRHTSCLFVEERVTGQMVRLGEDSSCFVMRGHNSPPPVRPGASVRLVKGRETWKFTIPDEPIATALIGVTLHEILEFRKAIRGLRRDISAGAPKFNILKSIDCLDFRFQSRLYFVPWLEVGILSQDEWSSVFTTRSRHYCVIFQ